MHGARPANDVYDNSSAVRSPRSSITVVLTGKNSLRAPAEVVDVSHPLAAQWRTRVDARSRSGLTARHNYELVRDDGTAAADCPFDQKPGDRFARLVAVTPLPKHPGVRARESVPNLHAKAA